MTILNFQVTDIHIAPGKHPSDISEAPLTHTYKHNVAEFLVSPSAHTQSNQEIIQKTLSSSVVVINLALGGT
jgi:hypothetical protein